MSTTVWPPCSPETQKREEDESLARELSWLLDSLRETLLSLKTGLEECYALLAPIEPGTTLAMSSVRSETVKGFVTRIGTRVTKGSLFLRLRTQPPIHLTLTPEFIHLPALSALRNLLNQSLDLISIALYTGDRHSAPFISSQLLLLHSLLAEARTCLKGPTALSSPPILTPLSPSAFSPPPPENLAMEFRVEDASLVLIVRVLEDADAVPDIKSRFFSAVGAQRRPEHDELDRVFVVRDHEEHSSEHGEHHHRHHHHNRNKNSQNASTANNTNANEGPSRSNGGGGGDGGGNGDSRQARGENDILGETRGIEGRAVRVKEKVRVESADPSLMAAMAKIGALEHAVAMARWGLSVVMEEEMVEV